MGITKILFQPGVYTCGREYDVLIPLPVAADACFKHVGFEDFGDWHDGREDGWDDDFCRILESLVGDNAYSVSSVDPASGAVETIDAVKLLDLLGLLAYNDQVTFVVDLGKKSITLTRGHEILWLNGFSSDSIDFLPFPVERIDNARTGDLF